MPMPPPPARPAAPTDASGHSLTALLLSAKIGAALSILYQPLFMLFVVLRSSNTGLFGGGPNSPGTNTATLVTWILLGISIPMLPLGLVIGTVFGCITVAAMDRRTRTFASTFAAWGSCSLMGMLGAWLAGGLVVFCLILIYLIF